jgi:hypothetical protein
MSTALELADKLVDHLSKYKTPSPERGVINECIEELRRLAAVEAAARNLTNALSRLDEGCARPGFRGYQNGNGEDVGDHVQDMREALQDALGVSK